MKNSKITASISLAFALLFLFSLTAVQAQQGMDIKNIHKQTLGVYGYPLGISEIEHTDSLTASQRKTVKDIKGKLDALAPGFKTFCRLGREIKAEAFSDYHPFKNVSKQESDLLNDQLAWDRLRKALRYLIDQKGVPEKCFVNRDPVYADSDIRGVQFKVSEHPKLQMDNNQAITEINQKLDSLETDLHQLKKKVQQQGDQIADNSKENDFQDSVLVDHSYWLDNHEGRLNDLENQSLDFSGYLGLGLERFASTTNAMISAGIHVGQVSFSSWYGYRGDIGTGRVNNTIVDLRRESYGGLATWYGYESHIFNYGFSLGPHIGWEHAEDAIASKGEYAKVYESILVGASFDVAITKVVHLKANFSLAPIIKSYKYDNTTFENVGTPVRVGISFVLSLN